MNKFVLSVALGASVGQLLTPVVLDALKIEPSAGFGMDDVVAIGITLAAALAARAMF